MPGVDRARFIEVELERRHRARSQRHDPREVAFAPLDLQGRGHEVEIIDRQGDQLGAPLPRRIRGYTQIELAERIGANSGADFGLRARQAEIERRDGRPLRPGAGSLDR